MEEESQSQQQLVLTSMGCAQHTLQVEKVSYRAARFVLLQLCINTLCTGCLLSVCVCVCVCAQNNSLQDDLSNS